MSTGLVVKGRKSRVGSQLHERRLTKQHREVHGAQGAFVPTGVPSSPIVKHFVGDLTKVLIEQDTGVVAQRNRIHRTAIIAPAVHPEQQSLQSRFTFLKEDDVHQIVVKEHANGDGVGGDDRWMFTGLCKGRRRPLNQKP